MSKKYIYMLVIFILFAISTYIFWDKYGNIENIKYVYNSNDLKCKYMISNLNEKNDNYEILVYYPITENKELNKKINESINKYLDDFRNNITDGANRLIIKFDNFENNNYNSFVFNVSMQKNTSHTVDYAFAYNLDNEKNKIVTIDNLLNNGYNLLKIKENLINELKENESIKKYGNIDEIKKYLDEDKEKYFNFYFSKENIVFFFNPGIIASNISGVIYVPININKIKQ